MEDKTYHYIYHDILGKVLELSESPRQFAEFLSLQIRELIGARTVVIAAKTSSDEVSILSIFPNRRSEWFCDPNMVDLARKSFLYDQIQLINHKTTDPETMALLDQFGTGEAIFIPLIAVNRMVGSILLLDIMDYHGIESVIKLLSQLSGVFALIIKNASLYQNLENEVALRTAELRKRNDELTQREQELQKVNQDYATLNETLRQNIEEISAFNIQLNEAKQKAEVNELHHKTILSSAMDGLLLVEQSGRLVEVNNTYCQMSGYTEEELLSMSIPDIEAIENVEEIETRIEKIIREGGDRFETRHRRKDGSAYDVEISIQFRVLGGGCFVTFVRDMTEQKKNEQALIRAKERAEESDRLKSAFLANMSHEIRTPMNGILGFTGLLKEPHLSGDEQQTYVRIIEKSGNRLLNIINDLIDLSKVESGQMEVAFSETNINEQLMFLHDFFQVEARQKGNELAVVCPLPNHLALIHTDNEKFYAILNNLIKNAIKFTSDGQITFGYALKESCCEFFVRDTGIGIPREKQKEIFERFVQVDSRLSSGYEGAGLGLSISRAFIELLHGSIWVESEKGVGTCFYFTLPLEQRLEM